MSSEHNPLVFPFEILGKIASILVFLSPVPTFLRVWKEESTEGVQSVPYVASLFSAMLCIYYAILKTDETLLITINSFGCLVEIIYVAVYVVYAPKQDRIFTLGLVLLLNIGGFCLSLLLSQLLAKGPSRVLLLGRVCVVFSKRVFVPLLSIIIAVMRTKREELVPFPLSLFLTLGAFIWLIRGVFLRDLYVVLPNIMGLIFGVLQMVLYFIYKNYKTPVDPELPQTESDAAISSTTMTPELQVCGQSQSDENGRADRQNEQEHTHHDGKSIEVSNQGQLSDKCDV